MDSDFSVVCLAICRWEMCGQVKVVVKTESEEEMLALQVRTENRF